jgi:hypothetical protein
MTSIHSRVWLPVAVAATFHDLACEKHIERLQQKTKAALTHFKDWLAGKRETKLGSYL